LKNKANKISFFALQHQQIFRRMGGPTLARASVLDHASDILAHVRTRPHPKSAANRNAKPLANGISTYEFFTTRRRRNTQHAVERRAVRDCG
jgi:hypothetical protein